MRNVKDRQLSLGNRQQYRGYEIVEVQGLVPYAILNPRGEFISFRSSVEEAKSRIDALALLPAEAVQLPERICQDGTIAVQGSSCDTCSSQDCEGCPTRRGEENVEYGESDRPEEEE